MNADKPGGEGAPELPRLSNCAQKAGRKPQTAAVGSLTGWPGPSEACLLQGPDA
jgi:hypothetical protein